jgi:hypothetical protein
VSQSTDHVCSQKRTVDAEWVHELLHERAEAQERLLRHEEDVPAQPPLLPAPLHRYLAAYVWPEPAQHAHEAALAAAVRPGHEQVAAGADVEAAVLDERRAGRRHDVEAVEPHQRVAGACTA